MHPLFFLSLKFESYLSNLHGSMAQFGGAVDL